MNGAGVVFLCFKRRGHPVITISMAMEPYRLWQFESSDSQDGAYGVDQITDDMRN
jgi:hypothetical protein